MRLPDLFAAATRVHGARLAIDVPPSSRRPDRSTTSYHELASMAGAVARALRDRAGRERVVAILLPRDTAWLYASQLGVLGSGAAHLCLDPVFPDAHVTHVLRDSAAVAVLTDAPGRARLGTCVVPVIDVTQLASAPESEPTPGDEHDLAYVIYTSGTTGAPKGVMLEHAGAVSLVRSGIERFGIGPGDRVAQGSSPAYDSSIEETWLALASGATVVVLDDETVRLGPDLVPWLRHERVTVLCPPPTLLRAMDCADPAKELPELRLCYVGGEAMPQDLVEAWGGALWLENGYGPTESTVTAIRGRLHPGEPVTIGTAVPGTRALVLDDRLDEVPEGTIGELCLAGLGLARGYLGRPDLTEERFVTHPRLGRLYRTGDLAVTQPDGRLRCLGRSDAQVKIRGYRIELEAIEAELARCPGVREAACRVVGDGATKHLVAFVVPDSRNAAPEDRVLEAHLRSVLPEYMVPARFGTLAVLPRTIGGKLDRKALPELGSDSDVAPRSTADLEARIAAAMSTVLGRVAGRDADFFALGGDSLRAALLISRLRREPESAALTVRDVYQARSAVGLATVLRTKPASAAPGTAELAAPGRPLLVTGIQAAWLTVTLVARALVAYAVAFELVPRVYEALGLVTFVLCAPFLAVAGLLAYTAVALWLLVLAKELLVGRYEAMRVPAWGSFHVRHWIVVHTARLVPWALFEGTGFVCVALRLLGARIGARVHVDRGVDLTRGGWDLLDIGDDVTLCHEASVGLVELDDGHLVVGPVRIGEGAVLEVRSGIAAHTVVAEDSRLCALSHLAARTRTLPGEVWDGVPARRTGAATPAPRDEGSAHDLTPFTFGCALFALRTLGTSLAAVPFVLAAVFALGAAGIGPAEIEDWLWRTGPVSHPAWIAVLVLASVAALPAWLLAQAVVLRRSGPAPLGTVRRWSWPFLRAWLRLGILESAGTWLSGTLFWPAWLRVAGMEIGRKCEISTILDVLPEHTTIGAESFFADGIYLGVPHYERGTVRFGRTTLGAGTFLGNHVVVPGGTSVPAGVLLGISTVADPARMAADTSWFGHPAFALPRREVVTLPRSLTHDPSAVRYCNRVFWEALRVVLPALPTYLALAWFDVVAHASTLGWSRLVWVVPAATAGFGVALTAVVLVLKWLLLGRVRPGQHALWSCWASRWDFHYVVWQRYGRALLAGLEGSLLLPWFLRAMGMRIGKRALLGDGFAQVVDPDMITIADGATVHALFQAHSFEDRVLKIDRIRIGANATVGHGAVLLYGAELGAGTHVAPHSVVMKHETLLPGHSYAGAPTAAVTRTSAAPEPARERAASPSLDRDVALDFARGVAVLGMVFLHFVPDTAEHTSLGAACAFVVNALHGKPAALFAVLAGMAFVVQTRRLAPSAVRGWFARRAAALALAGLAFWTLVWPTDVLLPLALMMPIVVALGRRGPAVPLLVALGLGLAAPVATALFGHFVETDCLEDGTHLANAQVGWCTLRYFLFDGSYPLVPWLALPLLGAAMVAAGHRERSRCARWFGLAVTLAIAVQAFAIWADADHEPLGAAWPYLGPTWQPTSFTWLVLIASWAVTVITGASWWQARFGLPAFARRIAQVGRVSLSHYLLHVLVVFAPLRLRWPAEDWGVAVGLGAGLGYAGFALLVTPWWLRRFARGPFEALLARISRG